jgi:membrane fusion protein (multidrug efflux system)
LSEAANEMAQTTRQITIIKSKMKTDMNTTIDLRNGNGANGTADKDAGENLTAVGMPATLRPQAANGEEHPSGAPPISGASGKRFRQTLATIAAAVVAVATGVYYHQFVLPFESTGDAFLEGHVTAVASQVPGRVAQLLVQDNQEVNKGDLLLQIDPRDYEARVAEAQANLTAARSQLEQARSQFAAAQAAAHEARADLVAVDAQASYAKTNLARLTAIGVSGVSQDQIDAAETQVRATSAYVLVAWSKISAADAQVALAQANIATAEAKTGQSEADARQAQLNLSYTKVAAPETGRVTRRVVEQGNYIQPGQSLLAIVPGNIWVVANFKETQLTHMRVGQPVTIRVDAYPQFKFKGHVDSIQSGSGARFSLFPPENATGNYIKVVQRVPVKIVLDETPESGLALGPGMSVDPKVRVK